MNKHIKSQSLAELSMVFLVVVAALFSMQAYMKRGIQAAIKAQADLLGPQQVTTGNWRFSSNVNSVTSESNSLSTTKRVSRGGAQSTSDSSTISRSGRSNAVSTLDYTTPGYRPRPTPP